MFRRLGKFAQRGTVLLVAGLVVFLLLTAEASAQVRTRRPKIRDSGVVYIDPAIPGDVLRLRYDAAFDLREAARAEFFYPRSGPAGPGLPQPERSVDYQDLSAYAERTVLQQLSGFVEVPVRWLNPEINPNAEGLGDMNAGFKYALIDQEDLVTTFQFRTYVPTGEARDGLGTDHVSLEPALLVFKPLTEQLRAEGELRYWIPIGGTDFAGDIIRYGVGLSYWLSSTEDWNVAPVVEFVGWTVLDGKTSRLDDLGNAIVSDASGTTIVNVKLGLRTRFECGGELFTGYGRALTGDAWYQDTLRVELRWAY